MPDLSPAKVARVLQLLSTVLHNEEVTVNQATAILSYMAVQALVTTGHSRQMATIAVMSTLQHMESIDEIPQIASFASVFAPIRDGSGDGPAGSTT